MVRWGVEEMEAKSGRRSNLSPAEKRELIAGVEGIDSLATRPRLVLHVSVLSWTKNFWAETWQRLKHADRSLSH